MSRTRIIKITAEGIMLSPDAIVRWDEVNLPHTAFRIKKNVYSIWEVIVNQTAPGRLQFEIFDYHSKAIQRFQQQHLKRTITHIEFAVIDWIEFEKLLAVYSINELKPYVKFPDKKTIDNPKWVELKPPSHDLIDKISGKELYLQKSIVVPFSEIFFEDGIAYVQWYFDEADTHLNLQFKNENFFSGLNLIKNYLPKALKKPKASIKIELTMKSDHIMAYEASSDDLESISPKIVEVAKTIQIDALSEPHDISYNKIIWESDELHDENVFIGPDPIQISDILHFWLQKQDVSNRAQLEYLSGVFQDAGHKIRITLHPDFGFIFTREGPIMWHFCWELPNSNATYLWSYLKDEYTVKASLDSLEGIISMIRQYGRNFYKSQYKESPKTYLFHAISHKSHAALSNNRFVRWKDQLESKIA